MAEHKHSTPQEKGHKSKTRIIALVCISIIAIILLLLALRSCGQTTNLGSKPGKLQMDENATSGKLESRSKEDIQNELNQKVAEGMIDVDLNLDPVFVNGEGNLNIINNDTNNYPQVVWIIRNDTGAEIYRSGGIPVGSRIETVTLNTTLAAGEYECTAYISNVDQGTGAVLGTARAVLTAHVSN